MLRRALRNKKFDISSPTDGTAVILPYALIIAYYAITSDIMTNVREWPEGIPFS